MSLYGWRSPGISGSNCNISINKSVYNRLTYMLYRFLLIRSRRGSLSNVAEMFRHIFRKCVICPQHCLWHCWSNSKITQAVYKIKSKYQCLVCQAVYTHTQTQDISLSPSPIGLDLRLLSPVTKIPISWSEWSSLILNFKHDKLCNIFFGKLGGP